MPAPHDLMNLPSRSNIMIGLSGLRLKQYTRSSSSPNTAAAGMGIPSGNCAQLRSNS